jgi:hypothetical protein
MRASRKALVVLGALTAGQALAQLGPPPPEYYAQQNGGQDCARFAGQGAPIVGAFRNNGPTNVEGVDARFEFEACFRAIEACERFVTEMRLDYPRGTGSCRRPGE